MAQPSRMSLLAGTLMVLGLALLVLGWGWNALAPSSIYWSTDQADEFIAAQRDMHSKTDNHGRNPNHEREFHLARDRFEKIHQDLEHARGARGRTGAYICAAGVLLILIGIGVHFGGNSAE